MLRSSSDSNSIVLVYTECDLDRSGDAVLTANTARSMSQFTDCQVVLTSAPIGVERFKKLYGSNDSDEVDVNGTKLKVVVLSDFMETKSLQNVVAYIEVGNCRPAPEEQVRKIVDTLKIDALFLAMPQFPIVDFHKAMKSRYGDLFQEGKGHCLSLGMGEGRIGMPIFKGEVDPIAHDNFCNLTKQEFGLVYFAEEGNDANAFIADYLRLASQYPFHCSNFVVIGPTGTALEGIKKFVENGFGAYSLALYDKKEDKIFLYSYHKGGVKIEELKDEGECPTDSVKIICFTHVPHNEMRSLLKHSFRFVAMTGSSSWAESFYFRKIALYQFLKLNTHLVMAHQAEHMKQKDGDTTRQLVELLIWRRIDAPRMRALGKELTNNHICEKVIVVNAELVKEDVVGVSICNTLGIFSSTNRLPKEGNPPTQTEDEQKDKQNSINMEQVQ